LWACRIEQFLPFTAINVHCHNSRTSWSWRCECPQDFSIARIDGAHSIAVPCGNNFQRAVARKIDERVLDGSGLADIAVVGSGWEVHSPETMPERHAVRLDHGQNVRGVQQYLG